MRVSTPLWVGTAVRVVAVLLAGWLVLVDAPMLIRAIYAGPVLVLVAGDATRRLLTGRDPIQRGDRLLNASLSLILGLIVLLGVVLVVNATGQLLTAGLLTLWLTPLTLALVLAAFLTTLAGREVETPKGPTLREILRVGVGTLLTGALLVGALAGARAIRPADEQKYAMLAFTQAGQFEEAPTEVDPGSRVTIGLGLTSYGAPLQDEQPEISVYVGDSSAILLANRWYPVLSGDPFQDGSTNEQRGTIAFVAPQQPGLYRVRIQIPDPVPGHPLLLTTDLQVAG